MSDTKISAARLDELIAGWQQTSGVVERSFKLYQDPEDAQYAETTADTASALRELKELREGGKVLVPRAAFDNLMNKARWVVIENGREFKRGEVQDVDDLEDAIKEIEASEKEAGKV